MNPDSFSSIVVEVPWGRFMISFRVVLNIFCICSSSFLVGFHASDPYVKIGMMVASMHCQMAFILIPLKSLSPVSASILWGQPLFWFLGLSGVLQGCLLCCIFFLGICIWVPLPVSCCLAWFCFFGLALFSLPRILLLQILYGTFLRRGLWYPSFLVGLSGRGGWGTRHPSTVGCSVGFLVLFVGLYYYFLVLWLFRL